MKAIMCSRNIGVLIQMLSFSLVPTCNFTRKSLSDNYWMLVISRRYCLGLLGFVRAVLMIGWRYSTKGYPKCPTHVVTSKPCQSAQTRELVSMRKATAMTHPSRVLNLDVKAKLSMPKNYI